MNLKKAYPMAISLLALAGTVQAQTTFYGNGATGFGGEDGNGNLVLNDTSAGLTITFTPGSVGLNNDTVLYLDTQPGGFSSTSSFMDGGYGDSGRTGISGYNQGNPSQTVATFAPGFGADYAISIENSFIGVFGLASGGQNSLNYLFGQGQSGSSSSPASITITPAQLTQLGLTNLSGQSFSFVGSLISGSGYRANETFGPSVTVPDNSGDSPNAGFNGSQTFTGSNTFTLGAVPEPGTFSLVGLGLAGVLGLRRRK